MLFADMNTTVASALLIRKVNGFTVILSLTHRST